MNNDTDADSYGTNLGDHLRSKLKCEGILSLHSNAPSSDMAFNLPRKRFPKFVS
ncbi:hypothetical protein SLEP1_g48521 [Rubroshorea leprosula]|uniref:Uncharacterized protein n=1 Tax=Rubroshorea leprosula TaxID=152421 RepID=A0AAV5LVT4_9ROSI|nr:hypothetical protein SLEP1_g48521 [Rubroshorea leprosula]